MYVVRGDTFQQRVTISTQQVRRWLLGKHEPLKGKLKENNMLLSHEVVSDSLRPRELQHSRLPSPSLTPRACSDSCLLSQWCHPTISSSVAPLLRLPSTKIEDRRRRGQWTHLSLHNPMSFHVFLKNFYVFISGCAESSLLHPGLL